jgi:hypothetical protein
MIFTNLHAENSKHINVTAVVGWKTEKIQQEQLSKLWLIHAELA